MTDWREPPATIDRHVPHASRIYDYLLGGTDHFPVDREAVERSAVAYPGGLPSLRKQVRANRDFLVRAVTYLVEEAGIRQFLDIGTGVPNRDNVHAVAQALAPDARIVYVDNDPTVLAHARTLLTSTPDGATAYIDGDLRHPDKIVREARETLDFDQPIAVMLVAVLHFIENEDRPGHIVRRLLDAVPSGSHLAVSHLTADIAEHTEEITGYVRRLNEVSRETFVLRSHADITPFFGGLDLVDPGLVPLREWRPGRLDLDSSPIYGAVARKP